ncbi:uncharacterized protein METZ01_LOCUS290911 [marine metagenome]|uniref:Uncharacterized protein n=1 Tax=marine metagenome TaxID=408172 RepID=A0A382LRX8_9ZZZZ
MNKLNWMWLVLAILYTGFFSWYTSFGGPLSQEEMDHYYKILEARNSDGSPEQRARLRKFMEEDTGDDFVMINVIDMYEEPMQISGVSSSDTSEDVLDRYMEYMYPALFTRACHPILFGEAANQAMDLMNAPGMEQWTRGAAMRYRSRRDMLEIASNPAFAGAHDFKIAAMAKTIAFPIDPWFHLGDPRLLLALLLGLAGSLTSWLASGATNRH